jgi:hypothetical protein
LQQYDETVGSNSEYHLKEALKYAQSAEASLQRALHLLKDAELAVIPVANVSARHVMGNAKFAFERGIEHIDQIKNQ